MGSDKVQMGIVIGATIPMIENTQTFTNATGTYDVYMLWDIAPKAEWFKVSELLKNMNEHIWGKEYPTPTQYLKAQEGYHWDVAMDADLRYSLILTPTMYVADGNHRLLKALHLGKTHLRARKFGSYDDMIPAKFKP